MLKNLKLNGSNDLHGLSASLINLDNWSNHILGTCDATLVYHLLVLQLIKILLVYILLKICMEQASASLSQCILGDSDSQQVISTPTTLKLNRSQRDSVLTLKDGLHPIWPWQQRQHHPATPLPKPEALYHLDLFSSLSPHIKSLGLLVQFPKCLLNPFTSFYPSML